MELRSYMVGDQDAWVMLAQTINTHFVATCPHDRTVDLSVTVRMPTPASAKALDAMVDAVCKANPARIVTAIYPSRLSYTKFEKESAWGTGVRPERSIKADLRSILESLGKPKSPDAASSMTGQIAEIWPNLEPLEQRITLAELLHNTPMTRAEVQAMIASLIERLVVETVKERAQP